MGKRILEHSTETTSIETGETFLVKKSISIQAKTTDDFFMIFIKSLSGFFKIKSAVDIKVLIKFCQIADFNTGQILLPTGTRKDICSELDIQNQHLSNSIARLKTMGLVTGEQGKFELNPLLSWKGEMKEREKLLKKKKNMQLDFRINFNSNKFD